MKVVLTKPVENLGREGDVVDVADGYARNFLVPQAMAVKATPGAVAKANRVKESREEAERRAQEDAERLAETLTGTRVVVAARAGDEGKLFGSIGVADIAEAVQRLTGIELDRSSIRLSGPIKDIGLHDVTVQPHPDVQFAITLDVIPA